LARGELWPDGFQFASRIGTAAKHVKLSSISPSGHVLHIAPIAQWRRQANVAALAPTGNLTYHGGKIMPQVFLYSIFWAPPTLQSGAPAVMSAQYRLIAATLAVDYPSHGIQNNSTQYYENDAGTLKYISNSGANGGQYTDTTAYPTGHCSYTAGTLVAAGNCITDADIQAEITKVMAIKGWTPGINKMYLLYTAQGEGSCFSSPCAGGPTGNEAYGTFCAYHSSFGTPASPVIYGNETYGEPSVCSAALTSPKNFPAADTLMSYTTHEITEAMTNPFGDAWWDNATGGEIGDICNTYDTFMYGNNTWKLVSGVYQANQLWNGHVYEVQTEWDQHANACVQVGP
jgi:hypothetical protein